MKKLSVLMPSRLQARSPNRLFLEDAVSSILKQSVLHRYDVQIHIGLDAGMESPGCFAHEPKVKFCHSQGRSQACALNAAAAAIDGDFVAILEDDDQWSPNFLEAGFLVLDHTDFVSSTQLEVEESGEIIGIVDYPTPSGWLMKRAVWDAVGGFNEAFQWHIDSEWLGRLSDTGFARGHLIEATAPLDEMLIADIRPHLSYYLLYSGANARLFRHSSPIPLISRLRHAGSGMDQIRKGGPVSDQSKNEYEEMRKTFGRIPW